MTIKNQNKNISAEVDITQLFDIEVEQDHGEITAVKLTRRDFYNDEAKTTYDLMDYFYTEQEIDNFVKVHLVVYDSFSQLPQNNGISAGKSNYIYLVPYVDSEGVKEGIYKEYVWVQIKNSAKYRTNETDHNDYVLDGAHYNYESLGSTEIDLSQIRQDIANLQSNKLDKTKVIDNLTTSTYNSSDPTALSAKQGKNLQDNKIDKTSIATNLTTNDDTKVLSAKQGKQLQDNKVDKSSIVDNVTDANTNPVTSNAVFDTISDVLDQLQSSSLLLNSNQPIIQNGQTSRLIARIYGDITSNDNILFYEKKTGATDVLLDTVSATNGVATYSYSGTGAGKKEFYVKHGSVVSTPYPVIDGTFLDMGLSDNHNDTDWNKTNLPTTLDRTDGTKIEQVDTTTGAFYYRSQSTTNNICIEFDAYLTTEGVAFFSFRQNSTNVKAIYGSQLSDYEANTWNHIKLEVKDDKYYLNGSTTGVSLSSWNRLFLSTYNGYYVKYKNFVIYPI